MTEFSFDDQKVSSLPLSDFMASGSIVPVRMGMTQTARKWDSPHIFFDNVLNVLTQKGIRYQLDPVYVSSEQAQYFAEGGRENDPQNELQRWSFKRLVARILLGEDASFNPAIGLGFNEHGMEMTMGTDVWVCRNMSIFGNILARSYGRDKLGMNEFHNKLNEWLDDTWKIHEYNMRILNTLGGMTITSRNGLQRLVGQLLIAQRAVYAKIPMHAPMNGSELNEFTTRLINSNPDLVTQDIDMNLYDVYNVATNILTHSENNLKEKWTDINEMGEFMMQEFNLN